MNTLNDMSYQSKHERLDQGLRVVFVGHNTFIKNDAKPKELLEGTGSS